MNVTTLLKAAPVCLAAAPLLAGPSASAHADTVAEALRAGKTTLNLRYRYESVDQANNLERAAAPTLRTALGLQSGTVAGWSGFLEFEDVTVAGPEHYNSGANGKTAYAVVKDPAVTEVNQAYLDYAGLPDTLLRFGRQRIILDNARFVGNVGWRQNEQTYDGVTLSSQGLPQTRVSYSYLTNVDSIDATNLGMSSHLLNIAYTGWSIARLSAYAYLLDFDNTTDSGTVGLRATGAHALGGDLSGLYTLEYAKQSDYADAPSTVDADYLFAEAGVKKGAYLASLGYEVLGGDGSYGFSTPLATKHAFNGWADMFLVTPADGLVDAMLSLGGTVTGVNLLSVYHDFSADHGGADYGKELDLQAVKKLGEHYSVGAKYADYRSDGYAVDTKKYWVWAQAGF